MSIKQIDFSEVLRDDQVYNTILANYDDLGKDWIAHQWTWLNAVYWPFKDHYKYLILISLIEKTLNFYDQVDITFNFDQYYSKKNLYIDKFSISELCENLKLPKETVRRKVLELEKFGVIIRKKKNIIINQSAFPFIKPVNQIYYTSRYIYLVSEKLYKEKVLSKKLDRKYIENIIKKNFTLCWGWYFKMQIPMITGYQQYFKDITVFHIWGTVVLNQAFNYSKKLKELNTHSSTADYINFNEGFVNQDIQSSGVSAMSISDMTGIPRATVVRKCKFLIKKYYLSLNDKKQYILTGSNLAKLTPTQKEIFRYKAKFIRKILNLCSTS
jgi:predicted transcriptional regulator